MSEPADPPAAVDSPDAIDPKDAMRLALERKKQLQQAHDNPDQSGGGRTAGRPQHQAAGKRVFRRKAGG